MFESESEDFHAEPPIAAGSEIEDHSADSSDENLDQNESNTDEEVTRAKKKKPNKPMFSMRWLDDPQFKDWLQPVEESRFQARCSLCNSVLGAKKSDLVRHRKSKKHFASIENQTTLVETAIEESHSRYEQIKKRQILADLKYAMLVASHNFSFSSIAHITKLSKQIYYDSELAPNVNQRRTKCSNIIKNVLAPVIMKKLAETLRDKFISVLLDESSDISNIRLLCILVRFIDDDGELKTQLLDIVKIDSDEGTAKGLYALFKKTLSSFNLDIRNIVGYCSDNASVMMGNKESFKTYLLKDNPHIITSGCICHSAHLVAVAAAESIPSNVETLLHNIYAYFSRSPKRQSILEEIQRFFNKAQHKILGLSKTRWLALSKCVERVLEQWDVLLNLFRLAVVEDKNPVARLIYEEMQNPYVKAYLTFFKYILPTFNKFNSIFQSEKVLIHLIAIESERFIRELCNNFVKPEFFYGNQKLIHLNIYDPNVLLPIENIYLGPHTLGILVNCENSQIVQFKLKCLTFYQKAVAESLQRFPVKEAFFSELGFLLPERALTPGLNNDNDTIFHGVLNKFKHLINPEEALIEFRRLNCYFLNNEKDKWMGNLSKNEVIEFWYHIKNVKNFNEENLFLNIGAAALLILSLPHGNADVERVFSMMTDIKTKKRNRILPTTLSALLRIKLDLHANANCCLTYPFNEDHFTYFKNNLYHQNQNTDLRHGQSSSTSDIEAESDENED